MKSLKTIQTLAKIGKVLSKIVFIICIVGLVLCALGTLCMIFLPESFDLNSTTIQIYDMPELNKETMYASMAIAGLSLILEIILSKKAVNYFKHELAEGQPFTDKLATELRDLGILSIAFSIGAGIVIAIGLAIAKRYFPGIADMKLEYGVSSLGLGIAFLITAVICRYGASVKTADPAADMPEKL
ncbi:MAG: hypothetical protein K6G56_00350 [Clostridiales bacterium]|nr:hypothetical protein [Clostridiales bacterium]